MTNHEKLVALIDQSLKRHIDKSCKLAENIASDLMAGGVIVPPCVVYNAAVHQYQIITKTRQGYMVSEKTYPTRKEAKKSLEGRREP